MLSPWVGEMRLRRVQLVGIHVVVITHAAKLAVLAVHNHRHEGDLLLETVW